MEEPNINLSNIGKKELTIDEQCDLSSCSDEWEEGQGIVIPQTPTVDESPTQANFKDSGLPGGFKFQSERHIKPKLLGSLAEKSHDKKSLLEKCPSDRTNDNKNTEASPQAESKTKPPSLAKSRFSLLANPVQKAPVSKLNDSLGVPKFLAVSEQINSKDFSDLKVTEDVDFQKFESMNSNVFKPDKDCPYQKLRQAVKNKVGVVNSADFDVEKEDIEFHDISQPLERKGMANLKQGLESRNFRMAPPHTNGSLSFAAISTQKVSQSFSKTSEQPSPNHLNVHTFANLTSEQNDDAGS